MQSPFEGKQPVGVVYDTSMSRPDSVLALALLYGFQGKRESRMGSVCVNGAGLAAAVFCDVVSRFYNVGPLRNANQVLLPGLAMDRPLPPDNPAMLAAVNHVNEKGEPLFARSVKRGSDTSLPEAVIRNGVIFNAEAVMILSAEATYIAKSLDLLGVKDIYKQRVKRLVIVDAGSRVRDIGAMRKVLAEFPAPIFLCPKETGDALPFPGAAFESAFSWAPAHPIVDAYRAFCPEKSDVPGYDLAAALYAVHPDQGYFGLSPEGALAVTDDGSLRFSPGGGKVRALLPDPAQKEKITQLYIEVASAKPVVPVKRFRRQNASVNATRPASPASAADAKPAKPE
jgi:hypothetical protein